MEADGEGFTLSLRDGGPWGFRLTGGAEYGCPLQIAQVSIKFILSPVLITSIASADHFGLEYKPRPDSSFFGQKFLAAFLG